VDSQGNYTSGSPDVEAGFYSGYWIYNTNNQGARFTTGLVAYYTEDGGGNLAKAANASNFLTANVSTQVYSISGTGINNVVVFQQPSTYIAQWNLNYTVASGSQNAMNQEQGEIGNGTGTLAKTWMGNGNASGSEQQVVGYWSPDGSNWYLWGGLAPTYCQDSPYWLNWSQGPGFQDGGFGN
jgi:hypothetical protein